MNLLKSIETKSPVDKVIGQIKELISSGEFNPGDRLPSERMLCKRLGVSRTHLRDSLKKLEFYGILKTYPQSGTVVASMGLPALDGLITNMLSLHRNDFKSLVETRVILETNAAMFAAVRRTDNDLIELEIAFDAHKKKVLNNEPNVEEDLLFHLKIAEASKNSVLKSLMLIIAPDIMISFKEHNVCGDGRAELALQQHEVLLQHIRDGNSEAAGKLIQEHLKDVVSYADSPEFNHVNGYKLEL